jgi:ABC-type sugar transport system ATPase subunit
LRLIAGLEEPSSGTISVDGVDVAGVPPHRRNVALVFQNLALYSHLTVRGNLEFGGTRNAERGTKEPISEVAQLLGVEHLLDRYPAELSGGEQQRVALGRAIVRRPSALLLDEPLSSLDAPLRRELRRELKKVQRKLGMPTIYVTHDQAEALALGDRIAVLDKGRLQQAGSPGEIYDRPENRFVAEFFGPQGMNWIEGDLRRNGDTMTFSASKWGIDWPGCGPADLKEGRVLCGFRPENVRSESAPMLRGQVRAIESLGSVTYAQLQVDEHADETSFIVQLNDHAELPKVGEMLTIGVNPNRLLWFDEVTGKRLIG